MSYQKLLSLLTRSHKNLSYDLLSHDTWATAGSYRGHESWLSDLSDPTVPNVSPALPNIRFQEYSSDYILICCLHWGWMCFQEYISLDHLSHETQDPKRISSGFSLLMSKWNGEQNHVSLVAKIVIAVTVSLGLDASSRSIKIGTNLTYIRIYLVVKEKATIKKNLGII